MANMAINRYGSKLWYQWPTEMIMFSRKTHPFWGLIILSHSQIRRYATPFWPHDHCEHWVFPKGSSWASWNLQRQAGDGSWIRLSRSEAATWDAEGVLGNKPILDDLKSASIVPNPKSEKVGDNLQKVQVLMLGFPAMCSADEYPLVN